MTPKTRSEVNHIDGPRLEGIRRESKLIGSVLMSVNQLILNRSRKQKEYAGGKGVGIRRVLDLE